MTAKRRRTARHFGSYDDADMAGVRGMANMDGTDCIDRDVMQTDAILDALARREPFASGADAAIRLLGALAADVDSQRLSSVSITPST